MLTFQICDMVSGEVFYTITKHYGGSVEIPVNDARVASVTVDIQDGVNAWVYSLGTSMKVFYDHNLVFFGIVYRVATDLDVLDRTVIQAMDSCFRLKHRYVGFDDSVVSIPSHGHDGYRIDGVDDGGGLWSLIDAAEPSPAMLALSPPVPGTGIARGDDTSTPRTTKHLANRGANIWEEFNSKMELWYAPEWNMRPIDAENPGIVATWSPGLMVELSFFSSRRVDRRSTVVFHDRLGRDNCRIGIDDDGGSTINYEVRTAMGGQTDPDEVDTRVLSQRLDDMQYNGIMQAWKSTDYSTDSQAATPGEQGAAMANIVKQMKAECDADLEAYASGTKFFKITLGPQGDIRPVYYGVEEPYRYLSHFTEGDIIRGYKAFGPVVPEGGSLYRFRCDGRIKRVTLTDDEKGRTTTALECVPITSNDQEEVAP